jgi:hypothetical protein
MQMILNMSPTTFVFHSNHFYVLQAFVFFMEILVQLEHNKCLPCACIRFMTHLRILYMVSNTYYAIEMVSHMLETII